MILCSGQFDGLHSGHVAYLEAAKGLCRPDELLVCGVAPDAYSETLKGRQNRWTQADRAYTVEALMCVDAVISYAVVSIAPLICLYRPRLFIKGPDWKGRLPEDVLQACEQTGTGIVFVDTPGRHVSETQ